MFNRFAALVALMVGAILADIQVVRMSMAPTAVEPEPAAPVHNGLQSPSPTTALPVERASSATPPRHGAVHP